MKTILALGQFLTWFIAQQITLWCPPKCVPFELFNYPSLSYFVLVLTSPVTNLTNTTSIFHDFPWPTIINFHDFQGQENEILKFHDSSSFPWPVQTLRYFCDVSQQLLSRVAARRNETFNKVVYSLIPLCFAWILLCNNINGKFILLIFMVHFTKLFTIAPGVGLVDLLSHELFLQIQRPPIPLLPSPPQWRWAMRGTALYSQAKHLTVNIMRQQINYQRNLLKYETGNNWYLYYLAKKCVVYLIAIG